MTTEAVTCSADATAVYACINGGGNHPKATNKATRFRSGGGGNFPLVFASISYTNIVLARSAADTAEVPGTLSKTLVNV
jgi:hypothetical protein